MIRPYQVAIALLTIMAVLLPADLHADPGPQVMSKDQLATAYEKVPSDHYINYNYCGKLIEVKEYETAVEVCTRAIETGNQNTLPWSYLNRGIAYKLLGNIEAAKMDRAASKEHGMSNWLLRDFLPIEE